MKKILLILILFLVGCASSLTQTKKSIDLTKIEVQYDTGFVYVDVPKNHLMNEKMIKRKQPVKKEEIERDVHYVLQSFFYANGRKNRDMVLNMNENEMIDYILPDMIDMLGLEIDKLSTSYTVPVYNEVINPKEEYRLSIKGIIEAKQTANKYEILDITNEDNDKIVVKIKKRRIDKFQYSARMYDDYEKMTELSNKMQLEKDPYEKSYINKYIVNKITYNKERTKLAVIPLEHETRMTEVKIEFEYDQEGYLRLTKKGLISLIA